MTNIKRFFKDESGATAIEYGLLAALISIVGIGAFTAAGSQVSASFNSAATAMSTANAG